MEHSHHHHDHHMSSHDHGSHLASVALNSTVANASSLLVEGLQGAAEIVSDIAKNLTETASMDHSGHLNHHGHHMGMDMGSMSTGTTAAGMGGMGGMSHMKMYFHFGYDETILFYGWQISTIGGLIGSMLGIFCIAVLYEALKYFREFLFKKSIYSMQQYSAACAKVPNSTSNPNCTPLQYMDQVYLPSTLSLLSSGHVIQTLLHMLQFVISYCLMLIFMTYNVWLCLACTLGAGAGYFMFGWKKSVVVDVTEHCH